MNKWLIAAIIGIIQSLSIWLMSIFTDLSLLGGLVICVVMALTTVILIREKPNIYQAGAVASGIPINILAFGLDDGINITIGLVFVYGIFFVQLFQAIDISIDNFKYIGELIHKRITRRSKKDAA